VKIYKQICRRITPGLPPFLGSRHQRSLIMKPGSVEAIAYDGTFYNDCADT
jgi:hypothetical protein